MPGLPEAVNCYRRNDLSNCGHHEFRKENDIMDVWFDSGSTHAAVLETHRI